MTFGVSLKHAHAVAGRELPGVFLRIPPMTPFECRVGFRKTAPHIVKYTVTGRTASASFALGGVRLDFSDDLRQIGSDPIGHAENGFQRGVAKPPLDLAEHGLGNTATLGDRVV